METVLEPRLSPAARQLLEEVIDRILADPRGLDMANWVSRCGTVACIAGWVCIVADTDKYFHFRNWIGAQRVFGAQHFALEIPNRASALLGPVKADLLFYRRLWPEPFFTQLDAFSPGTLEYAEVTAARIRHFIAMDGNEGSSRQYIYGGNTLLQPAELAPAGFFGWTCASAPVEVEVEVPVEAEPELAFV